MNQNKKRMVILPLAMMFSLTGCDPKSYKPTTMDLEKEMQKCEEQKNCDAPTMQSENTVGPNGVIVQHQYHSSGMNHFLMYYYLFGGTRSSNYSNNFSNRIDNYSPSTMGRFASGGYAHSASSLSGARASSTGSSFRSGSMKSSSSRATISRGGFGSTGKSFSVRA